MILNLKALRLFVCSIFTVFVFLSSYSQECLTSAWHHGEGTFYGGVAGGVSGNCMIPLEKDDSLHCAINQVDYNNSQMCGACLRVIGPRGMVTVKVADQCPECKVGDLDLTLQAFNVLADPEDGRIKISWQVVPCTLDNTVKVMYKEGSSQFWAGIQIRNTPYPVASVDYVSEKSTEPLSRESYNYFVDNNGFGNGSNPGPYQFKITLSSGETLVTNPISLVNGIEQDAGIQFTTSSKCKDCAGMVDGNAFVDNCGKCVGGSTGNIPNADCSKGCEGYYCGKCIDNRVETTPCLVGCDDSIGEKLGYFGLRCKDVITGIYSPDIMKKNYDLLNVYDVQGQKKDPKRLQGNNLYFFEYLFEGKNVTKMVFVE